MAIEVRPLSGEIGAEIRGVDLSRLLDESVRAQLRQAWRDNILLLFRGQKLSDENLRASLGWLGDLGQRTMPEAMRAKGNFDPFIMMVSNLRDSDGRPLGSQGDGELWFHHDNCFAAKPHKATALYCTAYEVEGGHTVFSNGYLSYEALPDRLRRAIAGRKVLQAHSHAYATGRPDLSQLSSMKSCWQPAVTIHPETERRVLYVDRLMTARIEGYADEEGEALLQELFPYVERNDYEHVWQVGDFVVWDNRCSAHMRTDFPATGPRVLKRLTVVGDAPIPA